MRGDSRGLGRINLKYRYRHTVPLNSWIKVNPKFPIPDRICASPPHARILWLTLYKIVVRPLK